MTKIRWTHVDNPEIALIGGKLIKMSLTPNSWNISYPSVTWSISGNIIKRKQNSLRLWSIVSYRYCHTKIFIYFLLKN